MVGLLYLDWEIERVCSLEKALTWFSGKNCCPQSRGPSFQHSWILAMPKYLLEETHGPLNNVEPETTVPGQVKEPCVT
jgi:hypothetical protein